MTSTIKVDNIQKVSDGSNIIKKCGSTITIGSSGQTVAVACGATTSGMGRTGTVDWCTTAKTSPLTVASGNGYFINTTSGAITVTLPASPSAGDIVAFKDYAKTWDSNSVTVNRNGSKIAGSCLNASLSTEAQSVTLIYVDGTQGWIDIHDSTANVSGSPNYVAMTGGTTITCGDFKTHIFTASGTLCVSSTGNTCGSNAVDYLVVAGGGGGGGYYYSGGGGAGGFRMANSYSVPAPTTSPLANPSGIILSLGSVPVTVGAGGTGGSSGPNPPAANYAGNQGNVSTVGSITSTGGGGGGMECAAATPGGSGGGAAGYSVPASGCGAGGTGNTPPVSPPQGTNGGSSTGTGVPNPSAYGSGGGGAGAVGGGARTGPGLGGEGSFLGDPFIGPTAPSYGTPGPVSSTRYFAGGGGGGFGPGSPAGGPGTQGVGGGAYGMGNATTPTAIAGTTNTGGGGGGTGNNTPIPGGRNGGTGGSGIVMVRYKFQN